MEKILTSLLHGYFTLINTHIFILRRVTVNNLSEHGRAQVESRSHFSPGYDDMMAVITNYTRNFFTCLSKMMSQGKNKKSWLNF